MKIGAKPCDEMGGKIGVKIGTEFGTKISIKNGVKIGAQTGDKTVLSCRLLDDTCKKREDQVSKLCSHY